MISFVSLFLNLSSAFAVFSVLFAKFYPRLLFMECVAMSFPIGLTLSAWCALLVKSLLPTGEGLSPVLVLVCVIIHATVCYLRLPAFRRALRSGNHRTLVRQELKDQKQLRSFAFLSVIWFWMLYLLHTHCLRRDQRGFWVGGTTWADLPFHLNIMSSFLYGANADASVFRPLASVFFSNSTLAYPYLPDFHTAFNVAAGSSVREAMLLPGAVLLGSFVLLLYFLSMRLVQSHVAACGSVPLTIFTGGLGAWVLYQKGWTWTNFMYKDHAFHLVDNTDAFWFSLPAHILYPQRTTQFAYSLDVAILLILVVAHQQGRVAAKKLRGKDASPAVAQHVQPHLEKDVEVDEKAAVDAWEAGWDAFETKKPSSLLHRPAATVTALPGKAAVGTKPPTSTTSDEDTDDERPVYYTDVYSRVGPVSTTQKFALHVLAGFATGLLPLLQPHSFVSVGSVVAVVALLDVSSRFVKGVLQRNSGSTAAVLSAHDWASLWCWVAYGVLAFAVGLPQFAAFFGRVSHSQNFMRFIPIWKVMGATPVWLWFKALGLYVPLFGLSAVLLSRGNVAQWQFYLGFTAVFVEANLIIFQPWEMDNTKVFYIWVFGASAFVCKLLRSAVTLAARKHRLLLWVALPAVGLVYASLTISGVLCAAQETISNSQMFDLVDVEYARWLRENTPKDSVFLVPSEYYPRHLRVESALAGRAVLLGYAGWLSSHGMDYGRRTNEMSQIMSGSGDAYKWLLYYNVTHITVPWEHRKLFNVEFLNAVGTRLTSNGRVTVYEVAREELATAGKPCDPAAPNLFEKECRAKGCMYLPRFNGAKCQLSHGLAAGEPVEDCGTGEKMTEESCHDKGCGWFPNYKGPWCHRSTHRPSATSRKQTFQPMSILTPDYDCGWHGMDVQQCVDRGCVWIPAGSNPWCTYKGPDSKTMDQINNVEPL